MLWKCSGTALGVFWELPECSGRGVGVLWDCSQSALGVLWECFGSALGRIVLGLLCPGTACIGSALGVLRESSGDCLRSAPGVLLLVECGLERLYSTSRAVLVRLWSHSVKSGTERDLLQTSVKQPLDSKPGELTHNPQELPLRTLR